ncbi:mevalonate kinase [Aquibacillus sediminis]|uniref:mevalonate kinase n=1 Tax=Aquibacillus sediminis TaxID=2574734 RepID=UPI001107FA65|nr:mevalonate kinase [Aquibacillus sediminis]
MIELPQEIAVGSAHSKLILIGEHSVVYGKPAIALPFPMVEVTATIEKKEGTVLLNSKYYQGPIEHIPEKMQGIAACIKETFQRLQQPCEDITIHLHSTIPIGRGLGSSAAIALAIVRSLYAYFGQDVSKEELLALVHIAETYAHGNPSGIDMAAACSDYPIWFEKGRQIESLFIGAPFHLIVADSGRVGDTHTAVEGIREKYHKDYVSTEQAITKLGACTEQAKTALFNGKAEILGKILNEAHSLLTSLGVSDDGLNEMVSIARKAGALGAKLTGGGRGGCIIALARNSSEAKTIADKLKQMGAANTWYFTLSQNV